jgi:hypothetical protein
MTTPDTPPTSPASRWPDLPLEAWRDTYETLHMWTQVVGKIRLALTPWINHSWHVPLYVTARGLTTSPIHTKGRTLQIDFDFLDHRLLIATNDGPMRAVALEPRSVADFYREVMATLRSLGVDVAIRTRPVEVEAPIPFEEDEVHASYDAEQASRFARALQQANGVLVEFRSRFLGKCSPVHFFWGSFDLAVTRFSGRPAPVHPGGIPNLPDWVTRDAYSHEVSSAGWWPGGGAVPEPVFYSYMYPEPPGFPEARVSPAEASYHPTMREFLLPYAAVRAAADPAAMVLEFLESTYRTGAELAGWGRESLDCPWLANDADPRLASDETTIPRSTT